MYDRFCNQAALPIVISLHGFFSIDEGVNTVYHILNKFFLGFTKSSSVGDIENTVVGLGVLSMDTSDLDLEFVSNFVELILLCHKLWKLDVNGGSHGGTKVGWARGDVTKMLIMGEFNISGLEMSNGSAESIENFNDTSSILHGNDSELILFVDPDEESLGIIMEDTSSGWPVSIKVASS
jgi:hypothetical protein